MQKKLIALIIILCAFIFLSVYQANRLSKSPLSDLIIEEDDELYLILPISNKKVSVYGSRSDLEKADLDLLRAAEEKIWDKNNSYSENQEPYIIVYAKDGQVTLHAELIVYYDPPRIPTGTASTDPTAYTPPQTGCGIDHDHIYFNEVISKPTEPSTEAAKEEIITGNTEGPPLTHETIVP